MRVLAAADDIARGRAAPGPPRTGSPTPPGTTSGAVRRPSRTSPRASRTSGGPRSGTALAEGAGESSLRPGCSSRPSTSCRAALDAEVKSPTAEAHLIGQAGHFEQKEPLRRLGRGLLEVAAPEIADEAEYQRLVAEEEQRAHAATQPRLPPARRSPDPPTSGSGRPTRSANRVRTYVDAYTAPRRRPLGDMTPAPRSRRRRGEALCALLENLPVSRAAPARAAPPPA